MVAQNKAASALFAELAKRARRTQTSHIATDWKRLKRVRPIAVTWVREVVMDDKGRPLDDAVVCLLPEARDQHDHVLHAMIERTKAGAVLVVRQQDNLIEAIFETPVGTTSWMYRIEDRGDRKIVVGRGARENEDRLGLLRQDVGG